jgi:hypothetical protein
MSEILTFTPEQFNELLKSFSKPGLGQPPSPQHVKVLGLGCGEAGPLYSGVYEMLALGSPRLALAKALGYRLVPYYMNIRATFANVDTIDIPTVGSDVKIDQDTLIDQMTFVIINKSDTANKNIQQTLSDFFFNFQSGIEATLDVQGAPRPTLAPKFTPLKNLADVTNCTRWPYGFVLTYQQQLEASFRASVTLPYAPIEVILTFRAWVPDTEAFVGMTNKQAFEGLSQQCGITCDPSYVDRTYAQATR